MAQTTLKTIFASVLGLPEEQITPDLSPATTASWDSFNAIILITEIENAFNVKFGFDEAMAVKSFADVVALVASKGVKLHD